MSEQHYLNPLFNPARVALVGATEREGALGRFVHQNLLAGQFKGDICAVNPKYSRVNGEKCYSSLAAIKSAVDLVIIATPAATVPGIIDDTGKAGARARHPCARAKLSRLAASASWPQCFIRAWQRTARQHRAAVPVRCGGRGAAGFCVGRRPGVLGDGINGFRCRPGLWRAVGFFHLGCRHTQHRPLHRRDSRCTAVYFRPARGRARQTGDRVESGTSRARLTRRQEPHRIAGRQRRRLRFGAAPQRRRACRNLWRVILRGGGIGGRQDAERRPPRGGVQWRRTRRHGGGRSERRRAAIGGFFGADACRVECRAATDVVTWQSGGRDRRCAAQKISACAGNLRRRAGVRRCACIVLPHHDRRVGGHRARNRRRRCSIREADSGLLAGRNRRASRPRHSRRVARAGVAYSGIRRARVRIHGHLLQDATTLIASTTRASTSAVRSGHCDARYRPSGGRRPRPAQRGGEQSVARRVRHSGCSGAHRGLRAKRGRGGVRLNLGSDEEVRASFGDMLQRVGAARPDATLQGVTIQPMVSKAQGHEVMIGVASDPIFGPVLSFGAGGIAVEVLRDNAVALPPLNVTLARDLLRRTRVYRLLRGYRDRPPADTDALLAILLRVSDMVCAIPAIREIDLNPVLVDAAGAVCLDARVVIDATRRSSPRYAHLSIHPYPEQLRETVHLRDASVLTLRPIRPEDATME